MSCLDLYLSKKKSKSIVINLLSDEEDSIHPKSSSEIDKNLYNLKVENSR